LPLPQSLPTTRTELTFRCSPPLIELDALDEPVEPVELGVLELDDAAWSTVPVTSTRLPTFDADRSDELPSRM